MADDKAAAPLTIDAELAGAHVDTMAAMLGLEIRPEWRDAVVTNFATTARAAADILAFDLDDHCEPAETFKP